jgi:WD40 repeat protein
MKGAGQVFVSLQMDVTLLLEAGTLPLEFGIQQLPNQLCEGILRMRHDVHLIAFTPNGKILAAGCRDRSIFFWPMENATKKGVPLWVLSHFHTAPFDLKAILHLATSDGTKADAVRLWNLLEHGWSIDENEGDFQELIKLWG